MSMSPRYGLSSYALQYAQSHCGSSSEMGHVIDGNGMASDGSGRRESAWNSTRSSSLLDLYPVSSEGHLDFRGECLAWGALPYGHGIDKLVAHYTRLSRKIPPGILCVCMRSSETRNSNSADRPIAHLRSITRRHTQTKTRVQNSMSSMSVAFACLT